MRSLLYLALSSIILLSPLHADVKITEPPFYRGTTIQENERQSYLSLIKTISISPTRKRDEDLLSVVPDPIREYIKLYHPEREEPKKRLEVSLVPSGELAFVPKGEIKYKTKLEVFLNSPLLDYSLNYGNRLYLSGGFLWDGHADIGKLLHNPSEIYNLSLQENNFFANAYIIVDSPFSEQCLILNMGLDNLLKRDLSRSHVNISSTFEFPASQNRFSPRPYTNINIRIPLDDEKPLISAGTGIKMRKENSFMMIYWLLNYKENWPLSLSAGIKIES